MKISINRLTKLTTQQLLELESLEQSVFGDGALNRWHLPVIAKYGYLFLIRSSSPLGCASFIRKEKIAFLIGFWINKDYRNQGLGSKLLTEAINQLKNEGIESIELTIDPSNKMALKLYQKHGFKEVQKLNDFYGPQNSRLLLSANLVQF